MSIPRLIVGAAAAATLVLPAPAFAASTDGTLQGLVLTGTCDRPELKNVIIAPTGPTLFVPTRIIDSDFVTSRGLLHPYSITIAGEGLKSRHLGPGELFTKPGKAPRIPVICTFEGATKDEGPFTVIITGSVIGS